MLDGRRSNAYAEDIPEPEVPLRLICQKAFLLALVVTLACHDTSGPPPFPADFELDNINGRALPTFVSAIPEAPTITFASLRLDAAGRAVMTEHQRDINQGDLIVVHSLDYRVIGNSIEIGCLRAHPATMLCDTSYAGTISESAVSLTMVQNRAVVYNYKITPQGLVID
jgi:hypothetical protein